MRKDHGFPESLLADLRVLGVITRESSLTRAAEILNTTQPQLSRVLTRLRKHFADPLLVRQGRGLRPTPQAAALVAQSKSLIQDLDLFLARTQAFDLLQTQREFRILLSDVGMAYYLPPLATHLKAVAPGVRLNAIALDAKNFVTKLEDGDADLALGAFPKSPIGLRHQRLYNTHYRAIAQIHGQAARASQSLKAFLAADHILVTGTDVGHGVHQQLQQALEAQLPQKQISLRVPSFTVACIAAARLDAVCIVPNHLAELLAEPLGLKHFKPPLPIPSARIAQYWHERLHADMGHRWLREQVFNLFRE